MSSFGLMSVLMAFPDQTHFNFDCYMLGDLLHYVENILRWLKVKTSIVLDIFSSKW